MFNGYPHYWKGTSWTIWIFWIGSRPCPVEWGKLFPGKPISEPSDFFVSENFNHPKTVSETARWIEPQKMRPPSPRLIFSHCCSSQREYHTVSIFWSNAIFEYQIPYQQHQQHQLVTPDFADTCLKSAKFQFVWKRRLHFHRCIIILSYLFHRTAVKLRRDTHSATPIHDVFCVLLTLSTTLGMTPKIMKHHHHFLLVGGFTSSEQYDESVGIIIQTIQG